MQAERHLVIASAAVRTEALGLVNPILALGQIIVSIALIVAILPVLGGTGLSGTFGGDPPCIEAAGASSDGCGNHDRPAGPVRRLLAGVVHPRAKHDRLTAAPRRIRGGVLSTEPH